MSRRSGRLRATVGGCGRLWRPAQVGCRWLLIDAYVDPLVAYLVALVDPLVGFLVGLFWRRRLRGGLGKAPGKVLGKVLRKALRAARLGAQLSSWSRDDFAKNAYICRDSRFGTAPAMSLGRH